MSINKPFFAALSFSTGLSIKAGALLLIPSLLGAIHYKFGFLTLILSIYIIIQV